MKPRFYGAALFLLFIGLSGVTPAEDSTSGKTVAAADSSGFAAADSGIDTIDVSGYPEEMKQSYELVKKKCSQCHTFARVVNSNYALPGEWKRYVKRMRRKPGSHISSKDAKRIYHFLVYDSQQRKGDLIKKKTAAKEEQGKKKNKKKKKN